MPAKKGPPTEGNLATGKTKKGKPAPKSAKPNPFGGKAKPKKEGEYNE